MALLARPARQPSARDPRNRTASHHLRRCREHADGVDRLLHGSAGLRGWGQATRPDNVLLYPRGFDPETQSFRYEVNERFGVSPARRVRIPEPVPAPGAGADGGRRACSSRGPRDGWHAMMRRGGGMMGRRGGTARWSCRGRYGRDDRAAAVNPIEGILALRDSLSLTPEQVGAAPGGQRLSRRRSRAELAEDPSREQQRGGGRPTRQAIFQAMRSLRLAGVT
jgi:hypothetical protein